MEPVNTGISDIIGGLPYRMAFAGGWIDQPFVSRHNPSPPGSMVVVNLEPIFPFMARCGMGTSTRRVAAALWGEKIPEREMSVLVRELYYAENDGKSDPSGSQDMVGLVYPGVNRIDYDADHEAGIFPAKVETHTDPATAAWLEQVIHMVPINQRPAGYHPLGEKNLDGEWIRRLGQTGKECFAAILARDAVALGKSMNVCMASWEAILPHTVYHPTIQLDLKAIMAYYQARYHGAMYSGCGGGYLYVVSEEKVPGAFQVKVRLN